MNYIQQIDNKLITAINFDGSTVYDSFWSIYTNGLTWAALAATLLFYVIFIGKADKKAMLLTLCAFALMFTMCDQIPASIIKPLVARPRPSHNPEIEQLLSFVNDYKGGPFGFPSNHACNGFGVAMFLTLLFRNWKTSAAAFLWACGSCYSRMYLGVHYVSDILVGALLGTAIAILIYYFLKKTKANIKIYQDKNTIGIPIIYFTTVIVILCTLLCCKKN